MTPYTEHLGHNITLIDVNYQRPRLAGCYLIQQGAEVAIVETGTAHSVATILQVLQQHGVTPAQVRYIIPTHVHLDHAGASGQLMQHCTNAKLVVHPFGARHLINPEKLIAGTIAVYGAERYQRLYGELLPVDEDRIIEATDGVTLNLAGRPLLCLNTPGHARHHIAIWDELSQGLFTGDTFGLCYREFDNHNGPFIVLPSTPVQFDPSAWHTTIDRLMGLRPQRCYLTHFGAVENPTPLAQQLHREIDAYCAMTEADQNIEAIHHQLLRYYQQQLERHGACMSADEVLNVLGMDLELCAQGLQVWQQRTQGV